MLSFAVLKALAVSTRTKKPQIFSQFITKIFFSTFVHLFQKITKFIAMSKSTDLFRIDNLVYPNVRILYFKSEEKC